MAGPTATNPVCWLKADVGVYSDLGVTLATNAGTCEQWNDQSGNGNNATQTTSGARPTYNTNVLNGKPVLTFGGAATMQLPSYWFAGGHTVFIVWQQTTLVNYTVAVGGGTSNNIEYGTDNSSPANLSVSKTGAATYASNVTMAANAWKIVCWKSGGRDTSSTKAAGMYNASVRSNGVVGKGIAGTSTANGTASYIGASKGTGAFLKGQIAEVIIYNSVLSHAEVQQIEAYLSAKYAVSVSTDGGFVFGETSFSQWTAASATPIITVGTSGQFDAGIVEVACCYMESGTYYVFYTGWNTGTTIGKIGMASGTSLTSLTKQGVQLDPASAPAFAAGYISGANMFKFGSTYYLYFFGGANTGFEATPASIGVATASSPSGPWTFKTTALLAPAGSGWNAVICYRPYVVASGGTYYLFYNAQNGSGLEAIGYATASTPDGTYTNSGSNPIIANGNGSGWNGQRVGDPVVLPNPAGGWLMFYCGQISGSATPEQFGMATASTLSGTWTAASNPFALVGGKGVVIRPNVFYDTNTKLWTAIVDDVYQIYAATSDVQPLSSLPKMQSGGRMCIGGILSGGQL